MEHRWTLSHRWTLDDIGLLRYVFSIFGKRSGGKWQENGSGDRWFPCSDTLKRLDKKMFYDVWWLSMFHSFCFRWFCPCSNTLKRNNVENKWKTNGRNGENGHIILQDVEHCWTCSHGLRPSVLRQEKGRMLQGASLGARTRRRSSKSPSAGWNTKFYPPVN